MKMRMTVLVETSDEWNVIHLADTIADGIKSLGDEMLEGSNIDVEIESVHLENAVRIDQ